MTKTDRTETESRDRPTANQDAARRTKGIRFSNSEWQEVKAVAELHDVPAAEFIRKRIMDVACVRAEVGADAIPASLASLIARDGCGEEMEKLTKDAQGLQDQL